MVCPDENAIAAYVTVRLGQSVWLTNMEVRRI